MDAMLQTEAAPGLAEDLSPKAVELAELLDSHRGIDALVMDMRSLNFWTDFFVIATVTSNTHLLGLERHIKEYARDNELEIIHRSRRPDSEDEWCLLDLGGIVIHLMTTKTRQFFELERLWSSAPIIYKADGRGTETSLSL